MYNELSFGYAHAGQGLARRDIGGSGRWDPSKDWWIISRLTNYNVYWRIWWFWCLYFDSGRNKDIIYLSRQAVWVNCVGCGIVNSGPLGLLVNMDQLTPAQKTAVGKSSSDRLRLHLLKADYKLFTISEQTLGLRNYFCWVLSTWTRIRSCCWRRVRWTTRSRKWLIQESPADAGIPARRKNDEKNSSISKL